MINKETRETVLNLYAAGMSTTQITRVVPVSSSTVLNLVGKAGMQKAKQWDKGSMQAMWERKPKW